MGEFDTSKPIATSTIIIVGLFLIDKIRDSTQSGRSGDAILL